MIPVLLAIVPVMKGNAADPACPSPAIQPMQPVSSQRGRMRPDTFIIMGYIGPSRTPTSETATAPPMREGTSQTTSSRLGVSGSAGVNVLKGKAEPDGEEHVDEYRAPLANLCDILLSDKLLGVVL